MVNGFYLLKKIFFSKFLFQNFRIFIIFYLFSNCLANKEPTLIKKIVSQNFFQLENNLNSNLKSIILLNKFWTYNNKQIVPNKYDNISLLNSQESVKNNNYHNSKAYNELIKLKSFRSEPIIYHEINRLKKPIKLNQTSSKKLFHINKNDKLIKRSLSENLKNENRTKSNIFLSLKEPLKLSNLSASKDSFLLATNLSVSDSNFTVSNKIYFNILTNTRFWVQRVASPVVIFVGVVGNSMTIVIMTRKRMRSSTNCYLAALASVDMLYLTFTLILSFKHYPGIVYATPSTRLYWKLLPILMMLADACTNTSVWLTAAFTIERFIVISNPIKGKVICTESRAKKLCIFIFAFCTVFVIPTPFEWKVIEEKNNENASTLNMELSELGKNITYKSIYYWMTSVLFIFVPLIFLIVFNFFLILSVRSSKKERAQMTQVKKNEPKKKMNQENKSSKQDANNNKSTININNQCLNNQTFNNFDEIKKDDIKKNDTKKDIKNQISANKTKTLYSNRMEQQSAKQETKITIMLISVVILFLVCQLPVAINLIYTSIRNIKPKSNESYILTALNNILNLMVAVNAAGNFVLYCLLSQKYRRTLIALFCPCLKPKLNNFNKYNTTYATTYSTSTMRNNQSTTSAAITNERLMNDLKNNENKLNLKNNFCSINLEKNNSIKLELNEK